MMLSHTRIRSVFIGFSVLCVLVVPSLAFGGIGVGVGIGKVHISEALHPGGIYTLPDLPVVNTGTIPSDYEVTIQYNQDIPGIRPPEKWFSFSPETFHLDPKAAKSVSVTLTLPTDAKPGDYFAYLEAHPIKKTENGGATAVNVAAAAKLNFSIAPSNFFQASVYRIGGIYAQLYPWDTIVLALIFLFFVFRFVAKRVSIQVVRKP